MTHKRFSSWTVLATMLMAGCASNPVRTTGAIERGRWDSTMRVHDVEHDKNRSVTVVVMAEKAGPLRMEATALGGFANVASYLSDKDGFRCALYHPPLFFQGGNSENALKPLLKFPLSPVIVHNIVFDEPVRGSDWKCEAGEDKLVSKCQSASRRMSVDWSRHEGSRSVRVESPGYQMDWAFDPPKTDVQFKEGTFRLEPTPGVRVIRL